FASLGQRFGFRAHDPQLPKGILAISPNFVTTRLAGFLRDTICRRYLEGYRTTVNRPPAGAGRVHFPDKLSNPYRSVDSNRLIITGGANCPKAPSDISTAS